MRIKSLYVQKEADQEFDAIIASNTTSKTNLDTASKDIVPQKNGLCQEGKTK